MPETVLVVSKECHVSRLHSMTCKLDVMRIVVLKICINLAVLVRIDTLRTINSREEVRNINCSSMQFTVSWVINWCPALRFILYSHHWVQLFFVLPFEYHQTSKFTIIQANKNRRGNTMQQETTIKLLFVVWLRKKSKIAKVEKGDDDSRNAFQLLNWHTTINFVHLHKFNCAKSMFEDLASACH